MKKNLFVTMTAAFVLVLFTAAHAAASRVGYINVQQVVAQSEVGKTARAELNKLMEDKNKEIDKKRAEVEKTAKAVQEEMQKKEKMDKVKFAQLGDKFQAQKKELERMIEDSRADMTRREKQMVAQILQKANGVVEEIAKSGGYTVILKNPRDLAYIDPAADITAEVVKGLNKLK
jgi:outer membrane protein